MLSKKSSGRARRTLASLGVAGWLLAGCSDMPTEPLAVPATVTAPSLAGLSFRLSGSLSLASHTNLSDWNDDYDFAGSIPLIGAVVRVKDAKGALLQTSSTNSAGDFDLQPSRVPARLELVVGGATYTLALGSIGLGTMVVRSKLESASKGQVLNAELFPDDELNDVKDDGIGTQVFGRIAGDPGSGYEVTTNEKLIDATSTELDSIVRSHPGTALADKAEDALDKIRAAASELDKTLPDKEAALGTLEGAVGDLEELVKNQLLDAGTVTRLMQQLAVATRQVATQTLDQAIARGGYPSLISESQSAVGRGDALRDAGRSKDAMNEYKDALSKGRSALS